jgi:hypothetical protein
LLTIGGFEIFVEVILETDPELILNDLGFVLYHDMLTENFLEVLDLLDMRFPEEKKEIVQPTK